jgi:hypothetical protein
MRNPDARQEALALLGIANGQRTSTEFYLVLNQTKLD